MGVLMNTRGLMEIVVLNIGYDMGILPKPIFVMLVLMALVTTFMTTPLLNIIQKFLPEKNQEEEYHKQQAQGIFKVLVSIGNPENGKALLNVAKNALDGYKNSLAVTALHITPGSDMNPLYGEEFARESFKGINEEAMKLQIPIENDYKVTDNIEAGVVKTVNNENYDFLLVGAGLSLSGISFVKDNSLFKQSGWVNKLIKRVSKSQEIFYPGSLIKDKTKYFVEQSRCSVGIFVNRNFTGISSVVVVLHEKSYDFLVRYAHRLLKNNPKIQVSILDENRLLNDETNFMNSYQELISAYPESVKTIKTSKSANTNLLKYSFMLISYQCWNNLIENDSSRLENIPSTLIINKKESRFGSRKKSIE
jgi:hypothetical protein